ncbi:MAG: ester cyclase [Promethearchaeota archaeon]
MSIEENKALVQKLAKAFNTKDETLIDEIIAPDFVDYPMKLRGRDAYIKMEKTIYKGFPDVQRTITHIAADGDTVWFQIKSTGTHTGEYHGLAPTGKKFTLTGIVVYRIANGKVIEKVTQVFDLMDFYQQLGVIEYKGFPDETKSLL